ncbi:MAG TPA: C39 family peptidase [Leptolinea sp.]
MPNIIHKATFIVFSITVLLAGGCTSNSTGTPELQVNTPTLASMILETATIQAVLPSDTPTVDETSVPPPITEAKEMAAATLDKNIQKTIVPTDETGLPVSHYIYGIAGHKQFFKLGCEAAATRDWALFFGRDINEFEFQNKLPLSDNPEVGFVGSVNSKWGQAPPYAYGVHAGPVAQLLQVYDMPAKAVKDFSLTQLKQQIAEDRPVIVWVIGNVVGGIPYEYTAKDGQKVIVAAYEHVVIVTGYNETHIRYLNNDKYFQTPIKVFLNSWKVLGNMAIISGT